MRPSHHPGDDVLMHYAAATLNEGASVVIGVHLSICAHCRRRIDAFETLGGAVLDTLEPTPMDADAFAKVLQRIDAVTRRERPRSARLGERGEIVSGLPIPDELNGFMIGPWRFLGPGLKISRITAEERGEMNLFMLRAQPGTSLLEHGHSGDEFICVLKGAFSDQAGRYDPGDMAVADASIAHRPRVEHGEECICLVALDGKLRLNSFFGRMLQPIYGL